jgi:hypothetical protein
MVDERRLDDDPTVGPFGRTDPKMPVYYIARANREKLGMSGIDKIVTFDQSQSLDQIMRLPGEQCRKVAREQSSSSAQQFRGKTV